MSISCNNWKNDQYLIFPDSGNNGIELLLLRRKLLNWSIHNNIPHTATVENNEFRIRLEQKLHYTQFVLQWEYPRFFIVQQKIAA